MGIVVLGMHRSGTSATAHLLGELGCDFGGDLLEGREDNPDGYFEHRDVVEVHNDFLRAVGRTWDDPRPWQDEFASPAAAEARGRLDDVFERDFATRRLWVLKDPRLCRLLPLWMPILDRVDARFAVVHRHPLAVAGSLHRRDGMNRSRALLLWLRHVLEAERDTRAYRRAYFRFEELMADPQRVLSGVLQRLGLGRLLDGADRAADQVLEPSQVHHRADEEGREMLRRDYPWVDRCHRDLCRLDEEGTAAGHSVDADSVRAELEAADRLFHHGQVAPLVESLADSNEDRSELRQALKEKDRYLESLRDALERAESRQKELDAFLASVQAARQESEAANAEYVASLRETLEAKDRYAQELLRRIEELKKAT